MLAGPRRHSCRPGPTLTGRGVAAVEVLRRCSFAVLAVYLRQRGSSESKPVGAPHLQTGTEGLSRLDLPPDLVGAFRDLTAVPLEDPETGP